MKFKVYSNTDLTSKEALMTFDATSLKNAIEYASSIKKLNTVQFLKLFNVRKV